MSKSSKFDKWAAELMYNGFYAIGREDKVVILSVPIYDEVGVLVDHEDIEISSLAEVNKFIRNHK